MNMKLYASDETTVAEEAMLIIDEIMGKAKDLNLAQSQVADVLEKKGVCMILLGEEDQVAVRVRNENLNQALTAASSFQLYGKYNSKFTSKGLHILADVDLTLPRKENIGVVHSSYTGDLITPPKAKNELSAVWKQVNWANGAVSWSNIPEKYRFARTVTHNFIDDMLDGKSLKVWIAPIRPFAATIMVQYLCGDIEKAAAFRMQRINASQVGKEIIRPAGYSAWQVTESAQAQLAEKVELPTELFVMPRSDKKEAYDLMTLPETRMQVYLGGVPIQKLNWIPSKASRIMTFVGMLAKQPDFRFEILS